MTENGFVGCCIVTYHAGMQVLIPLQLLALGITHQKHLYRMSEDKTECFLTDLDKFTLSVTM